MRAFQNFTTTITTNNAYAKQALAHELYHCVQSYTMGPSIGSQVASSLWVIEGSAQYFSNRVYPDANYEWPGAQTDREYNPARAIYNQRGDHVYGTSLYFQSLEKTKSPTVLSDWVLSTKQNDNGKAERHRLSILSGFTNDFYTFAKQLSLKIVDTSGAVIPGLTTITPESVSISAGAAVLKTTPFTVKVFQISPPAGYTVQLSAPAYSHQRLAYRLPSETAWTTFSTLPATVDVSCTGTTILLLFISTKDDSTDSVKVSIKKTKRSHKRADNQCGGDGTGFILYPLQDPETLNAYCPSGTHITTLAAWCCPDGSELNEEHASEASVCCPKTRESSLSRRIL